MLSIGKEWTHDEWVGDNDDGDGLGSLYKQIFPYLYIDDTQTDVDAYICYDVDIPRIQTNTIKTMRITVWCICHKDCMQVKGSSNDYSGTRVDRLADAVERALRNYEDENFEKGDGKLGIGRLELSYVNNMTSINTKFYGRELIFTTPDFKFKG